jgi:GNAT superfamily N-acetyltransferase
VRLELTRDPERFAALAADHLAGALERNLLATVLNDIRTPPAVGAPPLFACMSDPDGKLVAAALRAPPWPMLVCGVERDEPAEELLGHWLELDPEPGGLGAEPACARALAAAWERLTGGTARLLRREGMHALEHVVAPKSPAPGHLRLAQRQERTLLIEWERSFSAEAGVGAREQAEVSVDVRLGGDRLFVWDEGGPVSYLARSGPVAGVMRIGPVYTPPELRRRGYATSAVAALARRSLQEGSRRCMLFTDLANPTSNRIYAAIGFRRFGDWEDHALVAPAQSA